MEENSMGRLVDNSHIEVKIDSSKIKNDIIKFIRSKPNGCSFTDLCDQIGNDYNYFFVGNYIKYLITKMIENCQIYEIKSNVYQVIDY